MSTNGSRFGPEARAAIVARVELGASFAGAAAAAGVKVPTAKTWLARGRRETSGPYREFADQVERARAGVGSTTPGSGVPDREETLQLLSTAARRGSVSAMLELMRWHERRRASWEEPDPLDRFDELAARRDG